MNPRTCSLALRETAAPHSASALPVREQPAYRLAQDRGSCSMVELLAVLIGGRQPMEISTGLLSRYPHNLGSASADELRQIKGIGLASACRIMAAIELGRRLTAQQETRPAIGSPEQAARLLTPLLAGKEQEYLVVVLLDTRNRALGEPIVVYHGSLNTSLVRVAEVVRPAIRANASAMLMAHGHPSGDPSPSPEDVSITRAVVEAGRLLDIKLLDHLIIGQASFVSMRERGLMP